MQLSKLSLHIVTLQCLLGFILPALGQAQILVGGRGLPQQTTTETARINTYMDRRDKVDLIRALKLKRELRRGAKIVALRVEASSNQHNAKLKLKLNGQKIAAARVGAYSSTVHMSVHAAAIGPRDRLILTPNKDVFVSAVTAVIQTSQNPLPPRGFGLLKARVRRVVRGVELLPIRKLVSQATGQRLKGMKIEKVALKAKSTGRFGLAQAQLVVNGLSLGMPQTLPTVKQKLVFELPAYALNVIGHDIRTLRIKVTGNARVEMVGIKKAGGTRVPRSFQVQVGKVIRGSERMSLARLADRAPGADMHAPVEALTVVARGSGNIMVTNGRSMTGSMRVSRGGREKTIPLHGAGTLAGIKLRASGNMVIESIRVKFQ